jgi:hypothetical protein
LSQRLSAKEFSEWIEFYHLEPFGWEADCYVAGIVAATVANVHRDTKKRQKPYDAMDFVPTSSEVKQKKRLDPKSIKAQLMLAYAGIKDAGKDNVQDSGSKRAPRSPRKTRSPSGGSGRRQGTAGSGKANYRRGPKTSPKKNRGT